MKALLIFLCLFLTTPALAQTKPAPVAEAATAPAAAPAVAPPTAPLAKSGLAVPRFVSLRAEEVNLRTGPGTRYPIDWQFRKQDLPVEITAEYDTWRRIRDVEGTEGWVHQSMLRGRRGFVVTGAERILRADPSDEAGGLVRLAVGVMGQIKACQASWCKIEVAHDKKTIDGWLRKEQFWGAYADEVFN